MKVLFLCSSPTPYKNPLFERLARRPGLDLSVAFCVWKSGTRPWDLGELDGVHYEVLKGMHLPRGGGNYVRLNLSILSRLHRMNPDVVVIAGYNQPTMMLAILYCVLTGTPFVMQGETWRLRKGWKARMKKRLLHPLLFKAGAFLVTGRLARKYWVSLGYPADRIRIFANTPDVEYFERECAMVGPGRVEELRAKWGCGRRRVAVFVGRLIKVKGVDLLLEALKGLDDSERPFILIAGDGSEREALEEMAKGLPVFFSGFLQVEQLPSVYAAASFFVLPSRREPWGVVVNEAMACGLPLILSSQVGAHADLLDASGEGNGVLVDGPKVEGLRSALRVMTSADDEQLERMGRRSREIIQGWKYEASERGFEEACSLACSRARDSR